MKDVVKAIALLQGMKREERLAVAEWLLEEETHPAAKPQAAKPQAARVTLPGARYRYERGILSFRPGQAFTGRDLASVVEGAQERAAGAWLGKEARYGGCVERIGRGVYRRRLPEIRVAGGKDD